MTEDPKQLENIANSTLAAVADVDATGRSADGRVTARLSAGFELVELAGLDLAPQDRAAIAEAINDAITNLQAAMLERLGGAMEGMG